MLLLAELKSSDNPTKFKTLPPIAKILSSLLEVPA